MRPIASIHSKTTVPASGRLEAPLLLALAAGLFVSGCQKSAADSAPGASAPAVPVQVQIAPAVKIPETTEYLSILKSRHSASINPQVEGQITRIFVKSGDRVETGSHGKQPGGITGGTGSKPALRQDFAGARAETI